MARMFNYEAIFCFYYKCLKGLTLDNEFEEAIFGPRAFSPLYCYTRRRTRLLRREETWGVPELKQRGGGGAVKYYTYGWNDPFPFRANAMIRTVLQIRYLFDPWIRDPGMGKKSGSGSGMNYPDHISESLETIFWVKYLNTLMRIRDSGWKKIRIRDPG
jgi:hypothetical protein